MANCTKLITNQQHRILIVDDDSKSIDVLYKILDQNNFWVYCAVNGQKSIDIAHEKRPDLILTDWEMPGVTGIDIIKELQQDPKTAKIPVIMVTGIMLTSENLNTALQAGAMDYVRKPIDEIELLARIRSTLRLVEEMNKNIELQRIVAEKQQNELQLKLQLSETELMNASLRLIQNSWIFNNIIEKLSEFAHQCLQKKQDKLSELISYIKTSSLAVNWQEFNIQTSKIHIIFMGYMTNILHIKQ